MGPRRTFLARPFLPLRNLELAVKRQFRLPGAVAACACMAARALSSGFSSVGRPRAKGAMRWPRTENRSALEHLTPSKCRRATGTTLNAEYLSVGLQVCCIVRCSSRCCCCPCFAAHTTHPRVTATAHDLHPPFTPSARVRRAQILAAPDRSSWIATGGADGAGACAGGRSCEWRARRGGPDGGQRRPLPRRMRDLVRKCARTGGPTAHGRGRCFYHGQIRTYVPSVRLRGAQVTTKLSFQKVGRLCVWACKTAPRRRNGAAVVFAKVSSPLAFVDNRDDGSLHAKRYLTVLVAGYCQI